MHIGICYYVFFSLIVFCSLMLTWVCLKMLHLLKGDVVCKKSVFLGGFHRGFVLFLLVSCASFRQIQVSIAQRLERELECPFETPKQEAFRRRPLVLLAYMVLPFW